jgi:hypothetical protein
MFVSYATTALDVYFCKKMMNILQQMLVSGIWVIWMIVCLGSEDLY